jgi:U3 small nucleolar RNA-associated protein 10
VGDGMLGLVPETTPFLAETREETEGGVEAATRKPNGSGAAGAS